MKNKYIKISYEKTINSANFYCDAEKQKLIKEAYLHEVDADGFRTRLEKWRKVEKL